MLKRVEESMAKAVSEGVFPSAELLVAKNGKIVHHMQHGDVREGSCFDIASLTKPFCTATLVMMLLEENLLKLSDTVYQWIGGARFPVHRQITIEHLLNHTSGLPAWQPFYRELPLDLVGTEGGKRFILDSCFNEQLINDPGKKTIYSDLGYIVLGEIIEQAGNAALDALFSNYISRPLNLSDTFFVRTVGKPISEKLKRTYATADQHVPVPKFGRSEHHDRKLNEHRRFVPTEDCPWRDRVVHGEVHDQNAYALGGVAGHAGLFSTASDIHIFISELVKAYKGESSLLSETIFKKMLDFDINKRKKKGDELFIGGWNVPSETNSASGHHFSNNTIGHLGYTGCSIWIDLKKNFWVVLLSNRIHPSTTNEKIKAFRPQIHDLIYNEVYRQQTKNSSL